MTTAQTARDKFKEAFDPITGEQIVSDEVANDLLLEVKVLQHKEIGLIKIDPAEFGLDKNEAEQVKNVFVPMLDKMELMEEEYNRIIKLDISDESIKLAKELRQRFVKIRTGTAEIHKKTKAYYLNGGRAIDAFKNVVTFALQGKEENLESIEKYFERIEEQRIKNLQEKRIEELSQYEVENLEQLNLWKMSMEVYRNFLLGTKQSFEQKKEAEAKEIADKLKKDEDGRMERERIEAENKKLKEDADLREKEIQKERDEINKKQDELNKKLKQDEEAKEEANEIAEQVKLDQELLEKRNKYKVWLTESGFVDDGTMESRKTEDGKKMILWKKVSEFII